MWKDALAWLIGVQQHVVWRLTGCAIYASVALQPLEQRLQPAATQFVRDRGFEVISKLTFSRSMVCDTATRTCGVGRAIYDQTRGRRGL